MALIEEDGTGVATANSFADLAWLDEYHADRGNTTWAAALQTAREQAAIKATDYIVLVYGGRFGGYRMFPQQALPFPRYGILADAPGYMIDPNSVPEEVKRAQAELALRALTAPLLPDQARGGAIKRQQIGPLEVEYFEGAASGTVRPMIDGLLAPFFGSAVGTIPLERS